jgi:hypothetical protein
LSWQGLVVPGHTSFRRAAPLRAEHGWGSAKANRPQLAHGSPQCTIGLLKALTADVKDAKAWLDTNMTRDHVLSLLAPYPTKNMQMYEISPRVNRATEDTPELIKAV